MVSATEVLNSLKEFLIDEKLISHLFPPNTQNFVLDESQLFLSSLSTFFCRICNHGSWAAIRKTFGG